MLAPLIREMIAAELPVLEAHGVSMWGYSVLVALDRSAIRTQAALAEAIGADKTRIIAILDELQQNGLIERAGRPRGPAGAATGDHQRGAPGEGRGAGGDPER